MIKVTLSELIEGSKKLAELAKANNLPDGMDIRDIGISSDGQFAVWYPYMLFLL